MRSSSWSRLSSAALLPLNRFIVEKLAPIPESREFKALYPFLTIFLGLLAAFQLSGIRTFVIFIVFSIIVLGSLVIYFVDARKLSLEGQWNLLFYKYYRPSLLTLTNKVRKGLSGEPRIDILTYSIGDFLRALQEASADFEQVSGNPIVNIASFDIEYVSLLKEGFEFAGRRSRLIPLSEFWTEHIDSFWSRVPQEIKSSVHQRLDRENFYALPIGWGLVGVGIFANDLTAPDVVKLIATRDQRPGFDFELFFNNVEMLKKYGYEVLCFDFWSPIAQLVSLNYTGHMSFAPNEQLQISKAFARIRKCVEKENIISDPLVLLQRVRASDKSIVIGGSTWLGLKGDLLPIAIPGAEPVYGAFCECLGILSPPEVPNRESWERDAVELMRWLADELCDQQGKNSKVHGSMLSNYLPGLLRRSDRSGKELSLSVTERTPMQIDPKAGLVFRQFSTSDLNALSQVKNLWDNSVDVNHT